MLAFFNNTANHICHWKLTSTNGIFSSELEHLEFKVKYCLRVLVAGNESVSLFLLGFGHAVYRLKTCKLHHSQVFFCNLKTHQARCCITSLWQSEKSAYPSILNGITYLKGFVLI